MRDLSTETPYIYIYISGPKYNDFPNQNFPEWNSTLLSYVESNWAYFSVIMVHQEASHHKRKWEQMVIVSCILSDVWVTHFGHGFVSVASLAFTMDGYMKHFVGGHPRQRIKFWRMISPSSTNNYYIMSPYIQNWPTKNLSLLSFWTHYAIF